MKVVINEKKVKRNKQIGQFALIGGFIGMGLGIFLIFQSTYSTGSSTLTGNWGLMFGIYILGFIISQVGIYFMNRARAADEVTKGLKGLPSNYTLYHFTAPVSHLLVGPAGVWNIGYYYQRGRVSYEKNKWRLSGGGFAAGYQRLFGQEGLGRPDLDADADIATMQKFLVKQFGSQEIPPVQTVLAFFHPETEVEADDAPLPTMPAKKLKDFFRKYAREHPFPNAEIKRITALFPEGTEEAEK
jgi:hypothetical protein